MKAMVMPERPLLVPAWIYAGTILAAYALVVLVNRQPPAMVDYPDWVYQGVLLQHLLSGHAAAGYVFKHYPVPNSLTTAGLGLLDCIMPWQWAGKLWIALYLALAGVSVPMVARAFGVEGPALLIAAPTLIVNLNFWYGHISFEFGICFTLLLAAMLVRGARGGWVGALLTLLFFTHMEACACALLLVLLWAWQMRRLPLLWSALPVTVLTVWYAAARFLAGNADARGVPSAAYRMGSKAFVVYKVNTFVKVFGYIDAQSSTGLSQSEHLLGRTLFAVVLLASLALSGLCLFAIARALAAPALNAPHRVLRIFALVLAALSAALPQSWLGVADPSSRLILMAALAGFLLVDWRRPVAYVLAGLSVFLCLTNLYQFASIQHSPQMQGHVADLPAFVMQYGHVEAATRLQYYEDLERGAPLSQPIFPTALFLKEPSTVGPR